jgi:hypothetical protein
LGRKKRGETLSGHQFADVQFDGDFPQTRNTDRYRVVSILDELQGRCAQLRIVCDEPD